jgi:hypothetical protein
MTCSLKVFYFYTKLGNAYLFLTSKYKETINYLTTEVFLVIVSNDDPYDLLCKDKKNISYSSEALIMLDLKAEDLKKDYDFKDQIALARNMLSIALITHKVADIFPSLKQFDDRREITNFPIFINNDAISFLRANSDNECFKEWIEKWLELRKHVTIK